MNSPKSETESITASRRKARELALQVLFQREFASDFEVSTALEYFKSTVTASSATWHYAELLLKGVLQKQPEIDAAVSEKSRSWKIERMAPVDLSILRVATFEILFGQNETPPKVAINEAVEIAKRYGSTDSSSFINGILDAIFSSHENAKNESR